MTTLLAHTHLLVVGDMDKVTFAQVLRVEKWLMDRDTCPTAWEPLLRIRRPNPRFHRGYLGLEHLPPLLLL